MKIKYEVDSIGTCKIKCPNGFDKLVYSYKCVTCKYYEGSDWITEMVTCSYDKTGKDG